MGADRALDAALQVTLQACTFRRHSLGAIGFAASIRRAEIAAVIRLAFLVC
jgi:hypothetical protein